MAKKVTNPEDTDKNILTEIKAQAPENKIIENVNQIPSHIADVLKKNPMYDFLYIDSHGGCFTADTPANIRGNAILYKNPFYKQ